MAKKTQNQLDENVGNLVEIGPIQNDKVESEIENLNEMLASVLNYLSDDEVEVIDIEYLLTNTKGLRDWWEKYKKKNRKKMEADISKKLSVLSLQELEEIQKQIKEYERKEE